MVPIRIVASFFAGVAIAACGCGAEQSDCLGLVLAGGGARGAYEIGVWKAICELGLDKRIVAISGTSVGGINGALFASVRDPEQCVRLWNQSVGKAFVANTNVVRGALQKILDDLDRSLDKRGKAKRQSNSEIDEADLWGAAFDAAVSALDRATTTVTNATSGAGSAVGVCDSRNLRRALGQAIPFGDFGTFESRQRVYVTAVNKNRGEAKTFSLNGLSRLKVVECLMATAAIPVVFSSVHIEGEEYVDGGYETNGGDNVPIGPIRDNHPQVRKVIVVYLKSAERLKRRLTDADLPGGKIVEIIPSRDIGGLLSVFNVSELRSSELMTLGYKDAMSVLK